MRVMKPAATGITCAVLLYTRVAPVVWVAKSPLLHVDPAAVPEFFMYTRQMLDTLVGSVPNAFDLFHATAVMVEPGRMPAAAMSAAVYKYMCLLKSNALVAEER